MRSELVLDDGPGKLKFIVLGGVALLFIVAILVLMRPDKPAPHAPVKASASPVAPATATALSSTPAVAAADPQAMEALAPATPHENPASMDSGNDIDAEPSQPAAPAMELAMADASAGSVPATSISDVGNSPVFGNDASDTYDASEADGDAFATESAEPAIAHKPRAAVRPEAPPAIDALHAWWNTASNRDFGVQYVGQATGQSALVFRFSKNLSGVSGAMQHIRITAADGAEAEGNWNVGGNNYVVVYQGLEPGRYTVRIDGGLPDANGKTLGNTVQGPIYIQ